ncbi:hypothetical protein N24_1452 [Corynebacterium suranareeae]|uniref:Uncharacterized protein n=1 Tax=Corynebacterium suranareeae TaxID=2506452 RepID=A0A160PQA2_9CORY|nr:hypothetical protein N24_1452 [Corynebacterium suranareeae]
MIGAVGTDQMLGEALSHMREPGADMSAIATVENPPGLAIITVSDDV